MNIAFVSSGNSVHVKKLANGLIKHGHSVSLYTLPNHNKIVKEFDENVKIFYLPVGGKLGYYLNAPILKKHLINGKYDVVNFHYVSGYGTLARLSKIQPLVASVFGSDVYKYPHKSKMNMSRVIKNLDAAKVITSTSHVMANALTAFYETENPIYVTPFGVDLELFKPHLSNHDSSVFTFGIVKKLEDVYGVHHLIKSFSMVLERLGPDHRCDVQLLIYGTGSKEDEYVRLAHKLGVSDRVEFHGYIKNVLVPIAFNSIDVACFPSESESFGVAAVEAMACGVPVLTSDASGFTEVVEDLKCGYIVPRGDEVAFSEKMLEMFYMDRSKLEKMGKYGCQSVRQKYDFEDNLELYIEAISKVIEG